jgi:glutamate synthase (NADPH/NADH) large chain
VIGAKLDRNGLRPGRYLVTNGRAGGDGLGSGRAADQAGRHSDEGAAGAGPHAAGGYEQKRLISDEEVKKQLAARQPYAQWVKENQITLDHLPSPTRTCSRPITKRF